MSTPIRSEGGKVRRVAVVGGGLAGLMTALELARAKVPVDLFSLLPVRRSPSISAQGGMNAAIEAGDSPRRHFEETVRAGEFLANQPPVLAMTEAAPNIVQRFDRMGVPFHRTPEGRPDTRRLSGSTIGRAVFAGTTTGQQMLHALDEQVRRLESELVTDDRNVSIPGEPIVRKWEHWELLRLVRDDSGVCVGLVAQDLRAMAIKAFSCDAVILASGGFAGLFAGSTASVLSLGSAVTRAYRGGAVFANAELVQFHPTAIRDHGRPKLVSDAARSEGGRLWVPKDPKDARAPKDIPERERDHFLERLYPEWGNLVAPDIAARAIHRLCVHDRAGVSDAVTKTNGHAVHLDLTHRFSNIGAGTDRGHATYDKLRAIAETAARFGGVDIREAPIPVFPAVHATLGGLWVDYDKEVGSPRNHATSIPGLYAVGDAACQYHGANRLPGNGILASVFGATLCGPAVATYRASMARSAYDLPRSIFDKVEKACNDEYAAILSANRDETKAENAHVLFDELAAVLTERAGIERDDAGLDRALEQIEEIGARAKNVKVTDTALRTNQAAPFVRQLGDAIAMARLLVASARRRDESRGVHFKPKAEPRSDAKWRTTTLAVSGENGGPSFVRDIEYSCAGKSIRAGEWIDASLLEPQGREIAKSHTSSRVALAASSASSSAAEKPAKEKPRKEKEA